ncbi:helix-turn-helix domain-containing protein [Nonomuraea sp. NPDC003201]
MPGVLLARLSDHRGLSPDDLSRLAKVSEAEVQEVRDGGEPSSSLLLRLAPALGWHDVDLLAFAGMPVPDELTPLDAHAGSWVASLINQARCLPPGLIGELRHRARSLPQQPRTHSFPPPRPWEQYKPSFGAALIRMLAHRNLDWTSAAKCLFCLTGLGLAGATIGRIGRGVNELSPDLLARLATLLGIPVDDLAAVTGIDLPENPPPAHPAAADLAGLIWDVRQLTSDQVRHLRNEAKSLQSD